MDGRKEDSAGISDLGRLAQTEPNSANHVISSHQNRRAGLALRRRRSQPHNGTYLARALEALQEKFDRVIVITDDQAHDKVLAPRGRAYVINVGSFKNGMGYGKWVHIDGWSEAVVEYIRSREELSTE